MKCAAATSCIASVEKSVTIPAGKSAGYICRSGLFEIILLLLMPCFETLE